MKNKIPQIQFELPQPKTLFLWAVPAVLLAYIYYPAFVWMVDRWTAADSYYGHGFFIPLVTLYWIYRKKDKLAESKKELSFVGFSIFVFGLLMQIVSHYLRFYFLSAFSFIVVLMGLIYFLYGWDVFRKIWFPLAFLALMVPLPLLVISQITLKMKFFVSSVSTFLINQSGIQAIQQGSYIYTPNSILLVGDPCSGLRSFLAFLCLGFVFAYDEKLNWWKKAVLIMAGLPLAVISNVIRVYFLGLVGEIYGMQYTGPGAFPHDASGVVVFVLAFALFLVIRQKLEALRA